jgi:hypothetical protein
VEKRVRRRGVVLVRRDMVGKRDQVDVENRKRNARVNFGIIGWVP